MLNLPLIEQAQIVPAFIPQNINTADIASDWVSFKNFSRCLLFIHKMVGAADEDITVEFQQATAVAGTSAKALLVSTVWHKIGATALSAVGTFTKVAITTPVSTVDFVTLNGVDMATDINESILAFEIKADDLDVDNGFDCINFKLEADDYSTSHYVAAYFVMYGSRQNPPLTAIAD